MCIGYKVVCGKKSFRPATEAGLQRIRYRLGKTTTRDECGPFAVFRRLRHARDFAARFGDQILLVEYDQSGEQELWKKNPPSFHRDRGFSRGYRMESAGVTAKRDNFPTGTDFADEVTPLRVVAL